MYCNRLYCPQVRLQSTRNYLTWLHVAKTIPTPGVMFKLITKDEFIETVHNLICVTRTPIFEFFYISIRLLGVYRLPSFPNQG